MRRIWIVLYCVVLCLLFPLTVSAEEIISEKEPLDIIFVIDCSGSMKTNDPSKIGLNMVQAFIDTVQAEGIRIGYVAYNDGILSYLPPESIETAQKREELKQEIGSITYLGDTDIGMGVSFAYDLLSAEEGTRKMIVLISDGETDLPGNSTRTEEQSNQELEHSVSRCRKENIQIYTVAFGAYEGNTAVLEHIAEETRAENYSIQSPENLIEVLYGIFQNNLFYRIQRFSDGIYAGGSQEVTCIPDASYLDEINILLLSSENVGETTVQYGKTEISLNNLSHYAVGKIEVEQIDASAKELVIRTETKAGQNLQIYVISYRKLTPMLEIVTHTGRNKELEYQIYLKDQNGEVVTDGNFFESFSWEMACLDSDTGRADIEIREARVQDGVLKGNILFGHSGTYTFDGTLLSSYGNYRFPVQVEVDNTAPSGSIPEEDGTILDRERIVYLDDYFTDADGDTLLYSILDEQAEGLHVQLDGNQLTMVPLRTGTHMVVIQVSDGEAVLQYVYRYVVIPLWQAYWWVFVLILAAVSAILWRVTHKPKPELERLTEEKKQNHFCGKLDAYFIQQPQEEEEIPPLSIQLNRVKDSRVSIGDLFGSYPKQAEALQLHGIYLIADENRSMILYHHSESSVMVGNAIVCKQIQYSISFGDIIYITSPDGGYDLEIHYIAVFQ